MLGAGLLARKAREQRADAEALGEDLARPRQPGGDRVSRQGRACAEDLDALGFQLVGYGCTTCIGNSGPLDDAIADAIEDNKLVAVSVLSGNRNFEGRVHPNVRANYLASPPLVVAYALLGTMNEDITTAPLGTGRDGKPVYLKDIWPTDAEVEAAVRAEPRPRRSSPSATARCSRAPRSGRRSRSTPAATPTSGTAAAPTCRTRPISRASR